MIKKIFSLRNALVFLFVLWVLMQLTGPDRSIPDTNPGGDIFELLEASDEIKSLVKGGCYDCHSYETRYPWYGYVAPVSWLLQNHITEAREHVNFSTWSTYDKAEVDDKLGACFDEIAKENMPLRPYTWLHPEADLTESERVKLLGWFKKSRLQLKKEAK